MLCVTKLFSSVIKYSVTLCCTICSEFNSQSFKFTGMRSLVLIWLVSSCGLRRLRSPINFDWVWLTLVVFGASVLAQRRCNLLFQVWVLSQKFIAIRGEIVVNLVLLTVHHGSLLGFLLIFCPWLTPYILFFRLHYRIFGRTSDLAISKCTGDS